SEMTDAAVAADSSLNAPVCGMAGKMEDESDDGEVYEFGVEVKNSFSPFVEGGGELKEIPPFPNLVGKAALASAEQVIEFGDDGKQWPYDDRGALQKAVQAGSEKSSACGDVGRQDEGHKHDMYDHLSTEAAVAEAVKRFGVEWAKMHLKEEWVSTYLD
ncbi:unnamed protein product, partial [Prorocentrum cordatum]